VVAFARRYGVIVCHDAMYSELRFDGYEPPSFLEAPGAREVGVEFHSLSKTYSMTGWRIGFAVGNSELVRALGKVKTNMDSGPFQAVQEAAISALDSEDTALRKYCAIYQERRDKLVGALRAIGLACDVPRATFYVWTQVPKGYSSVSFTERVLKEAGVVITPGSGFGKGGEGYVRFALTVATARLNEAVERLKALRL